MKTAEQYVLLVMLIMPYTLVQTSKSVDKMLKRDHSNESYLAFLFCSAVYYAVKLVFVILVVK